MKVSNESRGSVAIAVLSGIATAAILIFAGMAVFLFLDQRRLQAEVSQLKAERLAMQASFGEMAAAARQQTCINQLRTLDSAVLLWSLEQKKPADAVPRVADLLGSLSGGWPICPDGGHYRLRRVGETPTCSISGHALPP